MQVEKKLEKRKPPNKRVKIRLAEESIKVSFPLWTLGVPGRNKVAIHNLLVTRWGDLVNEVRSWCNLCSLGGIMKGGN